MLNVVLTLALAPAVVAQTDIRDGLQLTYKGSVAQLSEDRTPEAAEKTFELTLLLTDVGEAGANAYWLVEERGRGNWPWAERFGSVPLDSAWQADEGLSPALLYDRGDGTSVLPLAMPFLSPTQPLAEGATWEESGWTYEVQQQEELEGQAAWRVQVSNSYGPQFQTWLPADAAVAVGYNQKVFMGMGQEYQLQLRLAGAEVLADEALSAAKASFDALISLRGELDRPARTEEPAWNEAQLAVLAERLPATEETVKHALLVKLVRAAQRDLKLQTGRASAVEKLAAEQHGRSVPKFSAQGSARETLTEADLAGRVTVLHFWDYREPLQEPYGQVGYLDFLSQRRGEEGVRVFGVAVDGRLKDEESRGAALREIRKLKSFMNLSYPVLLDEGGLIEQFGDPRLGGAELPLFVVIDAEGKIAHYHVGFYEVDRNEGLKLLDAAVVEALGP